MSDTEIKKVSKDIVEVPTSFFGAMEPFINDEDITDVEYINDCVWTIDIKNKVKKQENIIVDTKTIQALTQRINLSKKSEFNKINPVLETDAITDTGVSLRIEVLHQDYNQSGLQMFIRKTPLFARIQTETLLKDDFVKPEILSFILNCVKAHINFIIIGEPAAGKTEFGKYLSSKIPDEQHLFIVEDTNEWHIDAIRPNGRNTSVLVTNEGENNTQTYSNAIAHSLRCNTNWLTISEMRGREVADYIKALSTGISGISTLHSSDVAQIPNRLTNMAESRADKERVQNDLFENNVLGILIKRDNESGRRYMAQVGLFYKNENFPEIKKYYINGRIVSKRLPERIENQMEEYGIENPFINDEVKECCEKLGIPYEEQNLVETYAKEEEKTVSAKEMRL